MLSEALDSASSERKITQREVAQNLGYKSAVVLSHMASGRVPVPIDRADDLSRILRMDRGQFLLAVLEQRFPDIDFKKVLSKAPKGAAKPAKKQVLVEDLEAIAGREMDDMPQGTIAVLRSVVGDANPQRRWAQTSEIPILAALRKNHSGGLDPKRAGELREFIETL